VGSDPAAPRAGRSWCGPSTENAGCLGAGCRAAQQQAAKISDADEVPTFVFEKKDNILCVFMA